jgi:hypothetical protein
MANIDYCNSSSRPTEAVIAIGINLVKGIIYAEFLCVLYGWAKVNRVNGSF